MHEPLVSVIIPMYNSERYIRDSVQSVLDQTWKRIEVIIINDGSTDASRQMIEDLRRNPKVHVLDQKNRGASAARNAGIRYAKGDYLQFLDADDLLHPEKIDIQMRTLSSPDKKALISGTWMGFKEDTTSAVFIDEGLNRDYDKPIDLLLEMWAGKGMFQPGVWLVSKELIAEAGLWNEDLSFNDDGEYFSRVILKSSRIVSAPDAIAYYRRGNIESLSNQRSYKSATSYLKSLQAYCKNVFTIIDMLYVKESLARNFSRFIYEFSGLYPDLAQQAEQEIYLLGYAKIPVEGGKKFKRLARIVGFKTALRLKTTIGKLLPL